ncbi:Ig-like domain-containing protein [Sphingomonas lacusdianchii]|uniref:Ig-like domain-containing protein n=1 Tax=Sphingomonas lacusdianchii TaxID=2917992 RepID=UPI001F561B2F|nr:Ig-like domain-containing protein [Sphingomonas sp. JXJ CY 53]
MTERLYVSVLQNHDNAGTDNLFIFGEAGETVIIRSRSGYEATATIGADGSVAVLLPKNLAMFGTGVNDQGLVIESEGSISALLSQREYATSDLSVIFGEKTLGKEYIIASQGSTILDGGQFSVQAIKDGTIVTFTLPNGQQSTVELDAGETFKFSTVDASANAALGINISGGLNLTGTLISSTENVAVFSGAGCANIGDGACDHLIEQMPPISALSQSYVLGEAFDVGTGNNLVRVVAAYDGTEVVVDGSVVATLSRGSFHEFTLSDTAAVVTTSRPALVAQYLQGATTAGGEGDPALSFVPGTDTWLDSYVVATPSGSDALESNLLNLIVPTAALDTLTINGALVDPNEFTSIAGTDLSVANVNIEPGVIRVEASEEFQLSIFGYDFYESYLTFGGASFASGLSNAAPVGNDDSYVVGVDTVLTVAAPEGVLANDTDAEDDPLIASLLTGPSHGTLALNADGSFTYTPDAGYEGQDSFVYQVSDGEDDSGETVVELLVRGDDPPGCPTVDRVGTVNGSSGANEVLTGADYHNTFFFSAAADTGDDRITNFGASDVLVTDTMLRDSNGDGLIGLGRNRKLDLSGAGGTIAIDGVSALRVLGEACEDNWVYGAAYVRPTGAKEGYVLSDDSLSGDEGDLAGDVFFFDTALDLDLGADNITAFGSNDLLVTTTRLNDRNGDGIIAFGSNRVLDLSGGTGAPGDGSDPGEGGSVSIRDALGAVVTAIEYDGSVTRNGVTYYVYSSVGSAADLETFG